MNTKLKNIRSAFLLLSTFLLCACQANQPLDPAPVDNQAASSITKTPMQSASTKTASATPTIQGRSRLASAEFEPEDSELLDKLAARQEIFAEVMKDSPPILKLATDLLNSEQQQAQSIAVNDARFVRFTNENGVPLRNEIFGIHPAHESDLTEESSSCVEQKCYRVELYNYAYNLTTIALVNLESEQTVTVHHLSDAQPELPPHLTELAKQIAMSSPEVREELGFVPTEATMANTKTALNQTSCEGSRHFCVAPTFVVDDRALWAIVDLTEGRLVGTRWTYLGDFSAGRPDETMIQREEIYERFCKQSTEFSQDGWSFNYIITSSDGLRVADVRYKDEPIIDSMKLVDWHVSYSQTDGFGYSDGIGCPLFSSSAVDAAGLPTIEPITDSDGESVGFALIQDFRHTQWPMPCNYRYIQRYEFYRDGSFRPVMVNLGRGCGDQGTYRPILRVDLVDDHLIDAWNGDDWQRWDEEGWEELTEQTAFTESGYRYRLTNAATGYFIEPGRGQFDDGGLGDNAFVYLTRHNTGEGDDDLITIGSCCNTDYRQGPELFIDDSPESTAEGDLVLWYVAQMENNSTPGEKYCWADLAIEDGVRVSEVWPCAAGPLFVRAQRD